jgi:hypothetical protein
MTRKEKIISIAVKFYPLPIKSMEEVLKMDKWCEDFADAILALPLEVPGDEEIEKWVNSEMTEVTKDEFYVVMMPKDVCISIENERSYPFTILYKIRYSNKVIGKVVDSYNGNSHVIISKYFIAND